MTNITRSYILHLIGNHPLAQDIIKDWGCGGRTWEEAMMDIVKDLFIRLEQYEQNSPYPRDFKSSILNDTGCKKL